MNAHSPLTPLAVSAEPLLRAIQANPAATPKVLAEAAGRHANHIARDLKALEAAGLIALKPTELTGGGVAALEAIDRAKGEPRSPEPAQAVPEGLVTLAWAQIFPDPHNPRRDFDSEEAVEALEELAASIDDVGEVLQNLVVRPLPNAEAMDVALVDSSGPTLRFYQLVSGERRWRAIGLLIKSGRRPQSFPIPCKIRDLDDAKAKRWALIENLKRVDLKPMEEARAFKALVDDGMSTEAIAVEVLGHERKQRYVQQRIQLLELTEGQQAQVDGGGLTIKEALDLIRNRPQPIAITDEQALLFLEIAHAVADRGSGSIYHDLIVDYRMEAAADEDGDPVQWLVKTRRAQIDVQWNSQQTYVRLSWESNALLRQLTGTPMLDKAAVAEALRLARLKAAQLHPGGNPLSANFVGQEKVVAEITRGGRYFTPFLNKPFHIHPDRLEELAQRQERKAADEAAPAKAEAERKAQDERQERNAAKVRALGLRLADRKLATPEMVDLTLTDFGHPLPWKWTAPTKDDVFALVDADGAEISLDFYDQPDLLAFVMAAVNAAGGHPPVVGEAPAGAAEDDADEEG
jgi:ParB/RepB/Spo0J family partition protein